VLILVLSAFYCIHPVSWSILTDAFFFLFVWTPARSHIPRISWSWSYILSFVYTISSGSLWSLSMLWITPHYLKQDGSTLGLMGSYLSFQNEAPKASCVLVLLMSLAMLPVECWCSVVRLLFSGSRYTNIETTWDDFIVRDLVKLTGLNQVFELCERQDSRFLFVIELIWQWWRGQRRGGHWWFGHRSFLRTCFVFPGFV